MRRTAFLMLAGALGLGCTKSSGQGGPAPEVAESQVKLDLPAVPAFEEPQPNSDGSHSVLEMRRRGKKFMDQDVKVKAYVVWVYDCATALGPEVVKDTPERCDKPNFRLGDTPDAREDQTIEVVDVPRAPRDDERKMLPKEQVAAMDAAYKAIPTFAVGQKVEVHGKWTTKSTLGFVNSDGLLEFKTLGVDGGPVATPAPGVAPGQQTKAPPPQ